MLHHSHGAAVNVDEAIRARRTHKVYRPDPVPREQLDELFELARWAPNHHLTNPWRFRVLGPRSLEALKQAHPDGAAKLDRAPTLVACSVVQTGDELQDEEDVAAGACAVYAIMLAAHARGIATYWRTPGGAARAPRAGPPSASATTSTCWGCCTWATPTATGSRRRGWSRDGLRRSTWTDAAQRLVTDRARRPGVHGALRRDQLRAAARRSRAARRGAGARPRLRHGRAAAVAARRARPIDGIGVDLHPGSSTDPRRTAGGRRRAVVCRPSRESFDLVCSWDRSAASAELAALARPGGLVLLGDGYWRQTPSDATCEALGATIDDMLDWQATLATGAPHGLTLVAGAAEQRRAVGWLRGDLGRERRALRGRASRRAGPGRVPGLDPQRPAALHASWAAGTRSGSRCSCSGRAWQIRDRRVTRNPATNLTPPQRPQPPPATIRTTRPPETSRPPIPAPLNHAAARHGSGTTRNDRVPSPSRRPSRSLSSSSVRWGRCHSRRRICDTPAESRHGTRQSRQPTERAQRSASSPAGGRVGRPAVALPLGRRLRACDLVGQRRQPDRRAALVDAARRPRSSTAPSRPTRPSRTCCRRPAARPS